MAMDHIFTGFGFGPIQSGLFAKEAFASGNFSRIVVAEIDQDLVDAVRGNGGSYFVNVAGSDGIEVLEVEGVELLNPSVDGDREALCEALRRSTEIVTSLPSVDFYGAGGDCSVASLLADALSSSSAPATIIYAAENNNHAAEILQETLSRASDPCVMPGTCHKKGTRAGRPRHEVQGQSRGVRFLNTVIGKMSQVVTDQNMIKELGLERIAPGIERAFLVEEFNRILVSRANIDGFRPGIEVFVEKDDLLPFEEAKLYGHNAIHALLAFIGGLKGYGRMTEMKGDGQVMRIARDAFIHESGGALVRKYADLGDELFTTEGYREYADDLLERMTNPYLADAVARAGRDVVRKLGLDDRIFGTMRLVVEQGIEPRSMAVGALAGLGVLLRQADEYGLPAQLRSEDWRGLDEGRIRAILGWLWGEQEPGAGRELAPLVCDACDVLSRILG